MLKKIYLIFLLVMISFVTVNAKSINFGVTDVKVIEKSGTIEAVDPSFASNNIDTDSTFNNINDYVIYSIKLKNQESEEYKLVRVEDDNTNNYIDVSYESDKELIEPGDTLTLKVKIEYSTLLKNVDSKVLDDFNVILVLENDKGEPGEVIINPKTSDNVHLYFVLLVISIIGIILLIKKHDYGIFLIVLPLIISPIMLFGKSEYKINVTFKDITVIGVFDVFEVEIDDGSGNTETRNIKYGDPIGALGTPTKDGYDFAGWVDENGNPVSDDTIITDETNVRAKFNIIHYSITFNLDGGDAENVDSYTIEDEITLNNPTKPGYSFSGWTEGNDTTLRTSLTIFAGSMGNRTFTAHFSANGNTVYHVIHMKMNMDGEYEEALDEELTGTTDSSVTPQTKEYEGFTKPAEQTVQIDGSGNTKVYYYYERNKYQFTEL